MYYSYVCTGCIHMNIHTSTYPLPHPRKTIRGKETHTSSGLPKKSGAPHACVSRLVSWDPRQENACLWERNHMFFLKNPRLIQLHILFSHFLKLSQTMRNQPPEAA